MEVLVFKTNIKNDRMVKCLTPVFGEISIIQDWSVDLLDCDKILRIETNGNTSEDEIISLVTGLGIACEVLDY